VVQVARDSFGNALGNSMAEMNWGGKGQQTEQLATASRQSHQFSDDELAAIQNGWNDNLNHSRKNDILVAANEYDGSELRLSSDVSGDADDSAISERKRLAEEIDEANEFTLRKNGLGTGRYNLPSPDS
jgi:hypothetical protein